ncbi:MAG: hypothetical protein ACTSP4_13140 [Candidatus Hodarchaeales archaeon]
MVTRAFWLENNYEIAVDELDTTLVQIIRSSTKKEIDEINTANFSFLSSQSQQARSS